MAENASGATPPAVAENTVSPAPAPAEARSLENTAQDLSSRVSSAKSPADIRALLSDARRGTLKEAPKPESAVPPAPETKVAPEAQPAVEVPAEETPADAPAEVITEEAPAAPEDADDDQDGPVSPSEAKKLRLRLREDDKVGRLAAAFQQRNRDMTLEEAFEKARAQLGIKPKDAAPEAQQPKSDLPETVEAVDTTLQALDAEREKAFTELRFEDVAKIDRKVRDLDRHRLNLERDGERKQTQAVRNYETTFRQSEVQAADLYPDAAKPDSPFGKRMQEIDASYQETGDAMFHDPEKPLRIAQMVAREMAIAPRRKGTPAAPAKPAAPPAVPAPKKGMVPTGSSRTTPPQENAQPAVNAEVQALKSVHDVRKFLKKVTTVPR